MSNAFADLSAHNPFLASAVDPKPVQNDDLDLGAKTALAVEIRWGDQVLFVTHLSPPRDVFVGDDAEGPVDYKLPMPRTQIASGTVDSVSAVTEQGVIGLERGKRHERRINEFTLSVACVAAAKAPPRGNKGRRTALAFWAASAAFHLAVIGALVMSPGASLDEDNAALDKSTQAYMLQLQKARMEKEIEQQDPETGAETSTSPAGSAGQKHAGASGQTGDPARNPTGGHYQIKGPSDSPEVKMAKTRALIESNSYGAIGALASVFGASVNTPLAFDGSDTSIGRDPNNFMGNLTGDHPGDSFGYNGLGPLGTGAGGGGWGDGIGLNKVGDFGHGCTGANCGDGGGWGGGPSGKPLKRSGPVGKVIETSPAETTGTIPPETIKRIIRANFPRFRQCYEAGLKKDPGLRGSVAVRFIIDNTGAIESASLSGGTMSDAQVSSCVLGVYRTLSFPAPESGKVMVRYPIDFQNDD